MMDMQTRRQPDAGLWKVVREGRLQMAESENIVNQWKADVVQAVCL